MYNNIINKLTISIGKPWWNETLSMVWNEVCYKEKLWVKCKEARQKLFFKVAFVQKRKEFDRLVQKAKRLLNKPIWFNTQSELLDDLENDTEKFWKKIGKVGVANCQNKSVPMEVVSEEGHIINDTNVVLDRWKNDFSGLYNRSRDQGHQTVHIDDTSRTINFHDTGMNEHISIFEVKKAVQGAKRNKSCGLDGIPVDVLKNDSAISFLHILFNICFDKGVIPNDWGKGIINPIPKSSTVDARDPLSYRAITLASCMYKLFSSILNTRLSKWIEENKILAEEQNGFRKGRSTVDQISSLTNIINTRKKKRMSTYCAFIDFKKAYDYVDRDILWHRLNNMGISGKIFNAIKALYNSVSACVRLNGLCSDWFEINVGLRQGCSLSPILFNLFLDDLACKIKAMGEGIDIGGEKVCLLLYADDMVLLSDSENGLQNMLNTMFDWCQDNAMVVNTNKSNIVHFRPPSIDRTQYEFHCGDAQLTVVEKYTYLGLILTEFLDYNVTAKVVAQSASRALGLLIAKSKCLGGLPFHVFSKLYDSMVWPVIAYGAAIWGDKSFACINAVQYRAMRFFLGTGKYTSNAAVSGDMGWQPPVVRQWKVISQQWFRFLEMDNIRLNKTIFDWCNTKGNAGCKNWCYNVRTKFDTLHLNGFSSNQERLCKKRYVHEISTALLEQEVNIWLNTIDKQQGISGRGQNKLRTYRLMKREYKTETYCLLRLPLKHRSAFAKFRCGVAPIRIETGRYEGLDVNSRTCPLCKNGIEDEKHVILQCPQYNDIRQQLFNKAATVNANFTVLNDTDKLVFLFTNVEMIKLCAKTCFQILQTRQNTLYK